MFFEKQDERLYQRVIQHRKTNTLKYSIEDIDVTSGTTYDHRMQLIDAVVPFTSERMSNLLWEHYRKYIPWAWQAFMQKWVPICTNIMICYTCPQMMPTIYEDASDKRPFICGIGMYIRKPKHIYGRLLCSRCFVGGRMIDFIKHKYTKSPYAYMTFHAGRNTVDMYVRHGVILTDQVYVDYFGMRYPFMFLPFTSHQLPEGYIQDDCLHESLETFDVWFFMIVIYIIVKAINVIIFKKTSS